MSASKTNLQVREDTRLGIIIPDATEVFVGSVSELHEIRMKGAENRALGVTLMNAQSSRSHGVLRLRITKRLMSSGERRESRLHFVDLAGSEKVGKTQAQGQQLNEAKNINRSLTNLGLVITALAEGKFVPYRNSKLTRMLQESLGGNSLTTLILACSPSRFNDQETLSTLLFGQRAKKIKNTVKANVERSVRELEEMLKTAERKASDYEELLKKISSRSLDFISGSPLNQNTNRFKFQLGNLADKSQTIERGEPTKVSIALQTDPEHPPKHPASRPGSPAKKVLDSADELALLSNMTPEEEEAYLAKLEAETLVKLEEEERVYQESVRQVEEAKQRRREKYKEVETQTESGEAVFTNPEYITKAMELIEVQTELSRVQADNKLTMERVVSLNDELHSLKQELKKSQEDYSKLRDKNHSLAEDMKQDLEILASKLTESNIKQKSFAHEIDALILSNTFITTNLLLSSESKFREEQNTCLTELSEKLSRLKLDASSNCAYSECCSQLQGLLLRLNIYLNQQNQSTRDDNTEQNMDSLFLVKSPRNLDLTSLPSPSPIFLPNDDQSSVSLDLTLDLPKQDQLAQAKTITILHNQINSLKRKIEELTAQHKRQQREQKTAAVKVNNQVRQRLETELQAWKSQLKDVQREKELLELGLSSEKQKSHDFSMQIENIKRLLNGQDLAQRALTLESHVSRLGLERQTFFNIKFSLEQEITDLKELCSEKDNQISLLKSQINILQSEVDSWKQKLKPEPNRDILHSLPHIIKTIRGGQHSPVREEQELVCHTQTNIQGNIALRLNFNDELISNSKNIHQPSRASGLPQSSMAQPDRVLSPKSHQKSKSSGNMQLSLCTPSKAITDFDPNSAEHASVLIQNGIEEFKKRQLTMSRSRVNSKNYKRDDDTARKGNEVGFFSALKNMFTGTE